MKKDRKRDVKKEIQRKDYLVREGTGKENKVLSVKKIVSVIYKENTWLLKLLKSIVENADRRLVWW